MRHGVAAVHTVGADCASSPGGPGRSARSGYVCWPMLLCRMHSCRHGRQARRWTPWTSRCSRRCASTRAPAPWSCRASPASPAPRCPPGCSAWRTAASSPATARTSTSTAAGFGVQAFVTLEIAQGAIEDVQRDLEAIPGLLEAHATTGSGDVLCRVAASSHEALQQVLVDLNRSPAVVRSTSVVALSLLVPWRTLPLLRVRGRAGRRPVGHDRATVGDSPPGLTRTRSLPRRAGAWGPMARARGRCRSGGRAMATFVIVHGAWSGPHAWRWVRPLLRAAGHEVVTPSSTADARRHARPPVATRRRPTLDTQLVTDVAAVLRVGGPPLGRRPRRPQLRRHGDRPAWPTRRRRIAQLVYPPPLPDPLPPGLPPEVVWAIERMVPMPLSAMTQPLHLARPAPDLPRTYVAVHRGKGRRAPAAVPGAPAGRFVLALRRAGRRPHRARDGAREAHRGAARPRGGVTPCPRTLISHIDGRLRRRCATDGQLGRPDDEVAQVGVLGVVVVDRVPPHRLDELARPPPGSGSARTPDVERQQIDQPPLQERDRARCRRPAPARSGSSR